MPLLYFPSSYLEVYAGMSQLLLPSEHQDLELPSLQGEGMLKPVNAIDQKMEHFVRNAFQDENSASDEVVTIEVVKLKIKLFHACDYTCSSFVAK